MKTIYVISLFLISGFLISSCTTEFGNNCTSGSLEIEKRTVNLEPLTKLDLGISANLIIQEGTEQLIEIEAPSDIIDRILNESTIGSERWIIEIDGCYNGPSIQIFATLPMFTDLDISGSGDIVTIDTLRNVESLNLEIDGSGNMDIQLADAEKIDVQIKGSGDIDLISQEVNIQSYDIEGSGDVRTEFEDGQSCRIKIKGSGDVKLIGAVTDQIIEIEGDGDIFGHQLCSQTCDIVIKGSGDCNVKVEDQLTISIQGSGNVCYIGQPGVTGAIAGSGEVNDCN